MFPIRFSTAADAAPYTPLPASAHRVKLSFRIDFTNGGHLSGEGFLLDLPGAHVTPLRAAEMLVSGLNLLRAGPVTLYAMEIVRRGEHDDLEYPEDKLAAQTTG